MQLEIFTHFYNYQGYDTSCGVYAVCVCMACKCVRARVCVCVCVRARMCEQAIISTNVQRSGPESL